MVLISTFCDKVDNFQLIFQERLLKHAVLMVICNLKFAFVAALYCPVDILDMSEIVMFSTEMSPPLL